MQLDAGGKMSKYKMSDGTIVDTGNASLFWKEQTRWNGNNHVSLNTNSQWDHQKLYRSRKGRYYLEYWSQWQGSTPHAEWISNEEAARWLILNEEGLPEELESLEEMVTE
jgi:hypothetical protein